MAQNNLLKSTVYAAIDKFITTGIGFLFIPLAINFLGGDLFGVYIILTMFTLGSALSILDIGFGTSVEYYISNTEEGSAEQREVMASSLLIFLLLGTLFSLSFYLIRPYIAKALGFAILDEAEIIYYLSILTLNLWLQFIVLAYTAILHGMRLFNISYQINILYSTVQVFIVALFVSYNQNLQFIFESICLITLIRLLHLHLYLHQQNNFGLIVVSLSTLKSLTAYSFQVFINRIIGFINGQTDRVLILRLLSPIWMTVYEVVTKPIAPLRIIVQVFNAPLLPQITQLHRKRDYVGIKELYQNTVRYCYLIALPISISLFFFIDVLLGLWVGEGYEQYSNTSRIIIATYLILPWLDTAGTIVAGVKMIKVTQKYAAIAMVINVVLSVILSQYYGLNGLVIATLISTVYILIPFIKIIENKLDMTVSLYSTSAQLFLIHLPCCIASFAISCFIESISLQLFFIALLLIVQYQVNYRSLTKDEKKNIKAFLMRSY